MQWTVVKSEKAKQRGPKGQCSRPKWPRRGLGFMGREQLALLPTSYRVWASSVSCPSGVCGKAPAKIDFCVFLIPQKASSTTNWESNTIWQQTFWGARSIVCLWALNSEEARASVPHRLHRLWTLRSSNITHMISMMANSECTAHYYSSCISRVN